MKTRYSIDVRCRLTSGRRVFWTAAVRNPHALEALKRFYVRSGWTVEVFDDAGNLAIADACLDIGEGRITVPFGRSPGAAEYCVEIARLPAATGELTGRAKCTACDCDNAAGVPHALRGPTADDVAGHTPATITITPFDVHGCPDRSLPPSPAHPGQIPPLLRPKSWLASFVDWLTRAERGKAVYSE